MKYLKLTFLAVVALVLIRFSILSGLLVGSIALFLLKAFFPLQSVEPMAALGAMYVISPVSMPLLALCSLKIIYRLRADLAQPVYDFRKSIYQLGKETTKLVVSFLILAIATSTELILFLKFIRPSALENVTLPLSFILVSTAAFFLAVGLFVPALVVRGREWVASFGKNRSLTSEFLWLLKLELIVVLALIFISMVEPELFQHFGVVGEVVGVLLTTSAIGYLFSCVTDCSSHRQQ